MARTPHVHHWIVEDAPAAAARGKRNEDGRLVGEARCKKRRYCHAPIKWLPVGMEQHDYKDWSISSEPVDLTAGLDIRWSR